MRTHARKTRRKINPSFDFSISHRAAHKATRRGDVAAAERWMKLADKQLTLWSALYDADEAHAHRAPCPNCGLVRTPAERPPLR
jgi:hypothetical protein